MKFDVYKTQHCITALETAGYRDFGKDEIESLLDYLDDIFEGEESTVTVEDDYRWCVLKAYIRSKI